mmetsp:Transcript_43543/g.100251  ORF Transcript_43543/g.100251 Transcript_43543/m.100251 type:complete len:229 (-) Transcript_43543:826-1512(-)
MDTFSTRALATSVGWFIWASARALPSAKARAMSFLSIPASFAPCLAVFTPAWSPVAAATSNCRSNLACSSETLACSRSATLSACATTCAAALLGAGAEPLPALFGAGKEVLASALAAGAAVVCGGCAGLAGLGNMVARIGEAAVAGETPFCCGNGQRLHSFSIFSLQSSIRTCQRSSTSLTSTPVLPFISGRAVIPITVTRMPALNSSSAALLSSAEWFGAVAAGRAS